jgi:hypothetical protein
MSAFREETLVNGSETGEESSVRTLHHYIGGRWTRSMTEFGEAQPRHRCRAGLPYGTASVDRAARRPLRLGVARHAACPAREVPVRVRISSSAASTTSPAP